MKLLLSLALIGTCLTIHAQKSKKEVWERLDASSTKYGDIALTIWDYAEVGYHEDKSSALLQKTLKDAGFTIEAGVAGIPTAFVASYGSGSPVIGVLGEFDALPGLSQEAVPEHHPIDGKGAGHACGHHLFGSASAAAAIAVKDWMVANKIKGTIRFFGTPAEEGGSGKVYMVREGLFKDVDVVFHWHPRSSNDAGLRPSLANKSGKFRFYGVAAHAAASPEKGRSALDGVEAMNNMVNMMREHVTQESRIHYVITRGGEAPNVVPAFAEVYYYVRHPSPEEVQKMWVRLEKIAQGAALGTETHVEVEVTGGVYNLLPNETLGRLVDKNLREVGGYELTNEEMEFAKKIQSTLQSPQPLEYTKAIAAFEIKDTEGTGSTDVGDVSWAVPTAGFGTATWVPGTPGHSWQAVAAGGTSIGTKGMMVAAKTLCGAMMDAFSNPEIIVSAKKEFQSKRGNVTYQSLVGDRKPALNYRD